jgi:hypothetical protein
MNMKKILPFIIFAILLRLTLIPMSLHPDFRAVNLAGYLIAQKGQLINFYDFLSQQPRTDPWVLLYGDNLFIYPPLAYITHAVFNGLLFPLYPQTAFFTLLSDIGRLRVDSGFPLLMYLLKLPYLFADVICFFLLFRILPPKARKTGLLFWLFNPVTIYTSYLMGQFDIFIALFVLLAIYFTKKSSWIAAVMLGLGAGFKPFILVLSPFLPGNIWRNSLIAVFTYIVLLVPYLSSPAFRQYALLASQSDKLLFAKIMISGAQYIPLFIAGLVLVFWWRFFKPRARTTAGWLMVPLLLFYSFTHFHPQWFVWIMPLLSIAYATVKSTRLPIVLLLFAYLLIILFFENSLNFGLFDIRFSLPEFINRFYESSQLISIIRGIFAATAFYLISLIPSSEEESK